MGRKNAFEDSDFGSPMGTSIPPSRLSLTSVSMEEYSMLRDEAIGRLETKLLEASEIIDELCRIEGGGVGLSDRHEMEDLIDFLCRLQHAMRALKEVK